MEILLIVATVIIILFASVIAFGAPFLPTLSNRVNDALDLLDLKEGQTLLELGSGDGRLLKAAAKRGVRCIGYELNPLLVAYSKISTWRYRKLVTVHMRNYWRVEWPPSDAMYVFLLNPYMSKLHKKIMQYTKPKPYKLVSFAFEIPEKKPIKTVDGMHLYTYK